ncbi:MAG: ABC transporter permease [Eubacteriales bacterium]|nr:ABC transporter permease [Eubacteriales bacterium]
MWKHVLKKVVIALATIYLIITISFVLVHVMPGDPVIHLVGQEEYYYLLDNDPAYLEKLIEKYGLNDSLQVQYLKYLKSIVTLDFGIAYSNQRPVVENVFSASKWTLMLSVPVWILGGIIGAVLGVIAGWRPGKLFDKIMTPIFLVIHTMPSNCLSLLLLMIFSYKLRIFPINGMVSAGTQGFARFLSILDHMCLPLIILLIFRVAGDFMLMKSTVSQIRSEEYILTARSKGLPGKNVLFIHVMKNAMVPYLTSFLMQMGGLLSGSMIVEVVFGWKGMGMLMYNAVQNRDFPTAQFCFLLSAVCVVGSNLLSDIINAAVDPRIKTGGAHEA